MDSKLDNLESKRERWEFLFNATIHGAHDFRSMLSIDEAGFRMVAGYSHADARSYLLYKVFDEVQKAGVAIRRWVEFLDPSGNRQPGYPLYSLITLL